eukprot:363410-Chlamydomonas_euryale.AAC.7
MWQGGSTKGKRAPKGNTSGGVEVACAPVVASAVRALSHIYHPHCPYLWDDGHLGTQVAHADPGNVHTVDVHTSATGLDDAEEREQD